MAPELKQRGNFADVSPARHPQRRHRRVARRRIAGDGNGERVTEILVGDGDGAVDLRDVLRMAVAGNLRNRGRVGRRIDGRHVVGAGDGDHQVLRADIAVAVIDLGNVGERQRVVLAQPIKVGSGRIVVPADRLLLAIGDQRVKADGA